MKQPIYSISDIARELGISASTVSRALKDHPDISESTRRKVKEFANKVNYRPNALAISLKQQRSNTIGLIIPEIQHHFFSSVISGIEEFAYANEFRVMICQSNENYDREVINARALLDHRVDGVLVSISKYTLVYQHFIELIESGIPVVFFDRFCESLETDRVLTDDAGGAYTITRHLIERGHRQIIHLAAPFHLTVGRERLNGYQKAIEDAGINYLEELVIPCDTPALVDVNKDKIINTLKHATAIFAVNDFTAVATIKMLLKHGIRVPGDVAIAGFGDDPIASIVQPSLTTVEQKGFEMGIQAARMLINRIQFTGKPTPPQQETFATVLKIRESTGG